MDQTLKLKIRYLGIILVERDLEPGSYTLGRAADADIQLAHDFISRAHGKIYFDDDKWWYRDQRREDHPHYQPDPVQLDDAQMLELENDIDILTEAYLYSQDTGVYDIKDLKTMASVSVRNRRRIYRVLALVTCLLLCGGGYYIYYQLHKPMTANELLRFVRPKVVELERPIDQQAIADYKKYGGITEKELKHKSSFCSGVIIAPDVVLTASHCLNHRVYADLDHRFLIRTHDKKLFKPTRVLGMNVKRDVLFLHVPGLSGYGSLKLDDDVKVGKKVYTVGNVQGEGIAIRDGIMASTTKDPNHPEIEFLRYSAAASPGNSGGPLVDGFGRVIGLVFAATFAENYNLATAGEHLLNGKRRFVDSNGHPQKVALKTEDILFSDETAVLRMMDISIPASWMENPEYLLPFKKLAAEITLPASMEDYAQQVIQKLNSAALKVYRKTMDKMIKQGIREGSWQAHASPETPLLFHQTPWNNSYRLQDGRLLPEDGFNLKRPASFHAYKYYKKQLKDDKPLQHYPVELTAATLFKEDATSDTSKGDGEKTADSVTSKGAKPAKSAAEVFLVTAHHGKASLMYMGSSPQLQISLKFGPGDRASARTKDHQELLKHLVGKEGILATTSGSPFIRPKAMRQFSIKEIKKEISTEEITDDTGRRWQRGTFNIFDKTLDAYCLPLPQGNLCLLRLFERTIPQRLQAVRENFVRFFLSHLIVEPRFWEIDAVLDFYSQGLAQHWRTLKDFTIKQEPGGALKVRLDTLGLELSLPGKAPPTMIRQHAGLYRGKTQKEGQWLALELDLFFPDKGKERVCTVGVELKGLRSSNALESVRQTLKHMEQMKKNYAKSGKAMTAKDKLHFAKERKKAARTIFRKPGLSLTGGVTGEVYGYCVKLMADDKDVKKYVPGNYSELKPFEVKFEVK